MAAENQNVRDRADQWFGRLGRAVCLHPWRTLLLVLVPWGLLASQLPNATMDTSTEGFLHSDDPVLEAYNEFRVQFGRDELIVLALNPQQVFDFEFLERLRSLHQRLENEVPHVDEITSLINARATRGSEGELLVEDLLEQWPETPAELEAVKRFVLENPSYRNLLISEDGRFTTLVIKTSIYSSEDLDGDDLLEAGFSDDDAPDPARGADEPSYLTDEQNGEVVAAVRSIVEEFASESFPIQLAGSPVVTDTVKSSMRADMLFFIRVTILAIGAFLFVLFRRLSAVLLPLAVVILSLTATIGLMTLAGRSLKLPTMILPSFLLAVGVGDSVHLLAIFLQQFKAGMSKQDAIVAAMKHSGLPVVLTSLTTAGGLLSFAPTAIAPISDLGIFAPAGVMIAMVMSLTLLPALLALSPLRLPQGGASEEPASGGGVTDRFISRVGDFAATRPWVVVAGSVLLVAVAAVGAVRIELSHNPLTWLSSENPVRVATELLDRELRGTLTLEVVLDREGENAWYDPDALRRLESVSRFAEGYRDSKVFIGRAFSLADVLKEINKALNDNDSAAYSIPAQRELVAQEFLLFENSGSDDLEDLIDSQFSRARLTLKAGWVDSAGYTEMFESLDAKLEEAFGLDTEIQLTGIMALLFRTFNTVMVSLVQSYCVAFVVISVLMMLLIGSVRLGLLAMIPNLLPIALTLGVMGWLDFPLDTFTLLIGSIALGLAVDDTIHFMYSYRRYFGETGDSRESIRRTLSTAGRAMLFTTLVLSTGFFIFMLSSMNNLFNFGLLTGFAIIVALLADFLLAPALMRLIHGDAKKA